MLKAIRRQGRGFTLIELMVVIVILGILVSIGLANYSNARDRAREASVKANMHVYQVAIEVYGVAWGAIYPENVDALLSEPSIATELDSIDRLINPYTGRSGKGQAFGDHANSNPLGIVAYEQQGTAYFIYGYREDNFRIIDKGNDFILSNG